MSLEAKYTPVVRKDNQRFVGARVPQVTQ